MKRVYAVLVLTVTDAAMADTPERQFLHEEKILEDLLNREYVTETVDVFRVEHYS